MAPSHQLSVQPEASIQVVDVCGGPKRSDVVQRPLEEGRNDARVFGLDAEVEVHALESHHVSNGARELDPQRPCGRGAEAQVLDAQTTPRVGQASLEARRQGRTRSALRRGQRPEVSDGCRDGQVEAGKLEWSPCGSLDGDLRF